MHSSRDAELAALSLSPFLSRDLSFRISVSVLLALIYRTISSLSVQLPSRAILTTLHVRTRGFCIGTYVGAILSLDLDFHSRRRCITVYLMAAEIFDLSAIQQ